MTLKTPPACRNSRYQFHKENFTTGPYRGITIDSEGNVKIGCHDLTWQAIEECAKRFMPQILE